MKILLVVALLFLTQTSAIPDVAIDGIRFVSVSGGNSVLTAAIRIKNGSAENIQSLKTEVCFAGKEQDCRFEYFTGPFPKAATTWSKELHFDQAPQSIKLIVTNP